MGYCGRFVTVLGLGYLGMSMYSVYQVFAPSYCAGDKNERCYTPLWAANERVDIYFYTSEDKEYTSHDRLTHLLNWTNLSIHDVCDEQTTPSVVLECSHFVTTQKYRRFACRHLAAAADSCRRSFRRKTVL